MSIFEEIETIRRPVNMSKYIIGYGGDTLPPFTFPFTLTPCGATGINGPTQAEMQLSYFGTPLEFAVLQGAFQGYQEITIRDTGVYRIKAMAARGGRITSNTSRDNGRPCGATGEFSLNAGDVLVCIVGQNGIDNTLTVGSYVAAGGGGMSIVLLNDVPLVISGAGSAAAYFYHGVADGVQHGNVTSNGREGRVTTGSSAGGAMGESGGVSNGGAGAGWNADGHGSIRGLQYSLDSGSYFTGMIGGENIKEDQSHGGFGGGGAGSSVDYVGGGGGGGAGGGGGGTQESSNAYVGGGGGTYVAPSAANPFIQRTTNNDDNQYITITRLDDGDNSIGISGGVESIKSALIIPVRKQVRL